MIPFGQVAAMHGYAMACQRHMYEFGTTSKQLGAIAVACRKHASMTENAQRRQPITIDDYMNSKMYCDPFRLLDICQVTDGGAAVVVTSAERARNLNISRFTFRAWETVIPLGASAGRPA